MKGRQLLLGAGLAAALALPLTASATNGYFSHGYGAANKALAGAGVALPQDALAPATNPAGITRLGHRADLGLALFSPQREYTVAGNPSGVGIFPLMPGTYDSDSNYFLIPNFGYNRPLDDKSAFAISIYGNGGMNTDWPNVTNFGGSAPPGTYFAGPAGVDFMQLFITPTYAREVDGWSLGASAILAYQSIEVKGLGSFGAFGLSNDPTKLTGNGHDSSFGAGVRLGVLAPLSDSFDFGASFQSKVYMSEFDDYAGLFAEKGDFDIPANITAGIAVKTSDRSTLLFDIQHIWYSSIDSVGNPMMPALGQCMFGGGAPSPSCLGGSSGAGFGWKDMTIYKLGYQWDTTNDWTWRLGYSYGKQPIRSSEVMFNILAPGIMEHHFTGGFSKKIGDGQFNFAAMYAPEKTVKGANPLEAPGAQTIELSMYQFELEASYTWFFD